MKNLLIRNGCIAVMGGVIVRLMSIGSLLMSTHFLAPDLYGRVGLLLSSITIMTVVTGLGLRQLMALEYFHGDIVYRHQLLVRVISTYSRCIGIFIGLGSSLWYMTGRNYLSIIEFLCMASVIGGTFFTELLCQYLQYEQQIKKLFVIQIIAASTHVLSLIIFLYITTFHYCSLLYAQLVSIIVVTIIAWYEGKKLGIYQLLKNAQYWHHWDTQVYASIPFVFPMIINWIMLVGNRWIINYFYSMTDVGVYAVADTIHQLWYYGVLAPWTVVYLPWYLNSCARMPSQIDTIESMNQTIVWIVLSCGVVLIAMGYIIACYLAPYVLPPAYQKSLDYIIPLAIGQLFLLGTYFNSCLMQFLKKKQFIVWSLCFPALGNIILTILFLRIYGLCGAAYGTMLAYMLYFCITYGYNRYCTRMHVSDLLAA